ncbi:MAG: hypothetical protein HY326_04980 [Chloroflexi bacterium]|nr:hypothetical protein [Chloroflexota bacterium]
MADILELVAKIRSLELHLHVLEAELSQILRSQASPPQVSFAALEGLWRGRGNFSLEEMQETEIKVPSDL